MSTILPKSFFITIRVPIFLINFPLFLGTKDQYATTPTSKKVLGKAQAQRPPAPPPTLPDLLRKPISGELIL